MAPSKRRGQPTASDVLALPCPCGTERHYDACCGVWHEGGVAPDAESLMRSRYCAYVLRLESYLLATWHPSTRPLHIPLDQPAVSTWLGLQIKRHVATGDTAIVEFVARYRQLGRGRRLHEVSHFIRESGRWFYLTGEFADAQ